MRIRRFEPDQDLARLEAFLRERYAERHDASSWLPERLHDLLYRVGAQEADEGRERSSDYIFLWEKAKRPLAASFRMGKIFLSASKPALKISFHP